MIKIYTDGGCQGNPGPGGWAYLIIRTGDEILREAYGAEEDTTNNRMELRAVIEALKTLKSLDGVPKKASLYTDSQYVQKGISEWIHKWKQNSWRTTDRKPVKNQDLWLILDELATKKADASAEALTIEWVWVRGHSGNKYNELCDNLTQKAISSIITQ